MKCFGTTATEADSPVSAKSSRLGYLDQGCCKYEVNWLELVWLGTTENTEEHLCGDEHGVRKFRSSVDSSNQPDGDESMLTSSREIHSIPNRRLRWR